jgi:hypothetical protein
MIETMRLKFVLFIQFIDIITFIIIEYNGNMIMEYKQKRKYFGFTSIFFLFLLLLSIYRFNLMDIFIDTIQNIVESINYILI